MSHLYHLDPVHAGILAMVQERLPDDLQRRQAEGWSLNVLVERLVAEWKLEQVRIPKDTPVVPCRWCQEPVAWVEMTREKYKSTITVATGVRHLATCPRSVYLTDFEVTEYDRASNFGTF